MIYLNDKKMNRMINFTTIANRCQEPILITVEYSSGDYTNLIYLECTGVFKTSLTLHNSEIDVAIKIIGNLLGREAKVEFDYENQ